MTRDLTLPEPTADPKQIRLAAGACLKRVPLQKKLRLLGVRAGGLSEVTSVSSPQQLELDV